MDALPWSQRRMLNSLAFEPQSTHHLAGGIMLDCDALAKLKRLEKIGFARRHDGSQDAWVITDAGLTAVMS